MNKRDVVESYEWIDHVKRQVWFELIDRAEYLGVRLDEVEFYDVYLNGSEINISFRFIHNGGKIKCKMILARAEDYNYERMELEFFGLSTRAVNALANDGIHFLDQLVVRNEDYLRRLQGVGDSVVGVIKNRLAQFGLYLEDFDERGDYKAYLHSLISFQFGIILINNERYVVIRLHEFDNFEK